MDQPKLSYPLCRYRAGTSMVENEWQAHIAGSFVWEDGVYINRGMKVMDAEGHVYRILDAQKGSRIWQIWDLLWLRKPLYKITHIYEYLEQISLQDAKELLKSKALGKNYDVGRGVSRKEMAAYIDEVDSFPELFKRVDGF